MRQYLLGVLTLVLSVVLLPSLSGATVIRSSLNDHVLVDARRGEHPFSFFIFGHGYGSPTTDEGYPAATLLANIDRINDAKFDFIMSLGDMVSQSTDAELAQLRKSFLAKIRAPIFHVFGNHSAFNRALYVSKLGNPLLSFQYATSFFVFLDSEYPTQQQRDVQTTMLIRNIEEFRQSKSLKNIFIFSHRLIWAVDNPPYSSILPFIHQPASYQGERIIPIQEILARVRPLKDKNIYFASGDIGCGTSPSIFYEKEPGSNVHYLATGLCDSMSDAGVSVQVAADGRVSMSVLPFGRQAIYPIRHYDIRYLKNYAVLHGAGVRQKIIRILSNKFFWCGFCCAIGCSALLAWFFVRCARVSTQRSAQDPVRRAS